MKYYNYLLLFLSAGLIFFLAVFLLGSKDTCEVLEQRPFISSMTVSVPVPEEVEFCGEKIRLDRLDMRERYDREINSFTYFHSTTMLYFKRANRYFPVIEPILKKNGIPDDFKYLCMIESNLEVRSVSPAKAVGLWQFVESAGKQYGLEITKEVDERYHVEKSTEAACRYLKDAYNKYGDWATVAASYNAGMGRISTEMDKQRVNSSFDLLLVEETSRYVFRIMAAKQIFSNPYKYGFLLKKENLYPAVPVQYAEITTDVADFAEFAQQQGISYMQLKDFNPWLRDTKLKILPGKSYRVAIPKKEDLDYDKNKVKVHDSNWLRTEG